MYSTSDSAIAGRGGIAGIVVVDLAELLIFFRNRMISVPF